MDDAKISKTIKSNKLSLTISYFHTMNRLHLERKKKKKLYIIPLLIIVLLYVTIPIVLINKGSKLLEKASIKINELEVYSPTVEFYNGLAFLQTAASFPGFAYWSDALIESSGKEMIKKQEPKAKMLIIRILHDNDLEVDNIIIDKSADNNKPLIQIIKSDSTKTTIELTDSLSHTIDSLYCKGWNKFFEKTQSDKSKLYLLCKQ